MNKKMIARFIGKILMVEAVFMLPAYAISVFQHEAAAAHAFFITFVLTLLTGNSFHCHARQENELSRERRNGLCRS